MDARRKVNIAEEAAKLLYFKSVEDYKRAKKVASDRLGVKALPSNFEVAIELEKFSDWIEGTSRRGLLINMRNEALKIMDELRLFTPKLIGSVWRGTPKKGSDIDIIAYSDEKESVVNLIKKKYGCLWTESKVKTADGKTKCYFHIYFNSSLGYPVEVIVRSPERMFEPSKCEIYGDYIVGLTRENLRELLKKDSLKKFIPARKMRLATEK